MVTLAENPFAVLTAVVAPAVLTNASSVLCLGTSNRLARVVDRTRVIVAELASISTGSFDYEWRLGQLEKLQIRGQLLIKALRLLYAALAAFAASALIAVVGAALAYYNLQVVFRGFAVAGMVVGVFAVTGLVVGCLLMVRETTMAVSSVGQEVSVALQHAQA